MVRYYWRQSSAWEHRESTKGASNELLADEKAAAVGIYLGPSGRQSRKNRIPCLSGGFSGLCWAVPRLARLASVVAYRGWLLHMR